MALFGCHFWPWKPESTSMWHIMRGQAVKWYCLRAKNVRSTQNVVSISRFLQMCYHSKQLHSPQASMLWLAVFLFLFRSYGGNGGDEVKWKDRSHSKTPTANQQYIWKLSFLEKTLCSECKLMFLFAFRANSCSLFNAVIWNNCAVAKAEKERR